MSVITAIVQVVLVIIASSYQQENARKARAAAEASRAAAEDAAKGFEVAVEGEVIPIPVVYGRAKIAGARVWHATANRLLLEATTADNYIGTFDSLPLQTSSSLTDFVHPGTDNFRVTFDAGVQAQLATATSVSNHVTLYHTLPPELLTPIVKPLGADYFFAVTNVDSTGFNVTIKRKNDRQIYFTDYLDSGSLTGQVFQYKVPYVTLTTTLEGEKNEYLFMQQVLCQGPINRIYDVAFNDSRFIDDPELASTVPRAVVDKPFAKGVRVDCYPTGGMPHSLISKNFSKRSDALFTGLASVSAIVKLDRDAPQFNDIPNMAFFIEGKKIRAIIKTGDIYTLSGTLAYSNNPALCLLDYLLSDISGKGLDVAQVDLKTFYDAATLCAKIVQTNVVVGGKIWQPTDGWRRVTQRDIPLYECNLTLDVKKTVRANVATILSTMGDARLVWSGGKYKLSLQYPGE